MNVYGRLTQNVHASWEAGSILVVDACEQQFG